MKSVGLRAIWQARKRIAPIIPKSPLIYSPELSKLTGAYVHLKLENLNPSGSFKIRGAANKIISLSKDEQQRGITTFSTGNFGLSVAYMAKNLGIKAVICISNHVPQAKVEALKRIGADIEIHGESQDDAEQRSYKLAREEGYTVIHPFDDPHVIAGQGTIGLEILEDLPEVDTVIAGLSGGGLHAGLGIALKSADPSLRLIGVSPTNGATMYESLKQGKLVTTREQATLADSLLGGIGLENKYTFELIKQYVDEIILVNEIEIASGMIFMLNQHRLIIEGAAAAGIGAISNGKVQYGSQVVLVITGASVDPSIVYELARKLQ